MDAKLFELNVTVNFININRLWRGSDMFLPQKLLRIINTSNDLGSLNWLCVCVYINFLNWVEKKCGFLKNFYTYVYIYKRKNYLKKQTFSQLNLENITFIGGMVTFDFGSIQFKNCLDSHNIHELRSLHWIF